jgi:hypothetical protein
MLAPSKIPLDDRLPQLGEVASEAIMFALFATHLDPGWTLKRVRIKEARYHPGMACLLTYRLRCRHEDGRDERLVLHARAFAPGTAPDAFAHRPPLATRVGRLPSYLPQANLALWTFPDDPGILGMAHVVRCGSALFEQCGALDVSPWSGPRPEMQVDVVRYVPSKRCVLRYDSRSADEPVFFGKVYGEHVNAGRLYDQMCALYDWTQQSAPELLVSRPLGCDRRLNAIWQASPGGETFPELLPGLDLLQTMRRIAAAVAALHRGPVQPQHTQPVADEWRKLQRARDALLRFYPDLAREIHDTLDTLLALQPDEPLELHPIHGDLHCSQILLRDRHVAIIDFDLYAFGDPLLDVARLLSRFRALVRGKMDESDALAAQEGFLGTYEILVPWKMDRARLGALMAALMINRQALKPIKKLADGSEEHVLAMLAAAKGFQEEQEWR